MYIDGAQVGKFDSSANDGSLSNAADFHIGNVGASHNGSLDEVIVFNRSLSPEQVKHLYDSGKMDVIVSNETQNNEVWTGCIIPFDRSDNGTERCSDITVLPSRAPTTPDIRSPANDTFTANRTFILNCSNSTDPDGDPITYYFYNSTALIHNATAGTTTVTVDTNLSYDWFCNAADDQGYHSANTSTWYVNVNTTTVVAVTESHTSDVPSGTTSTLYFNVTTSNLTISNLTAYLNYNGTEYAGVLNQVDAENFAFSADVYIPFGLDEYSFFWNFTLEHSFPAGTTSTRQYNYTQTATDVSLYVCDGFNGTSVVVANLTMMDEVNETLIVNGSLKATFEVWLNDSTDTKTFTIDLNSTNSTTQVCMNPNNTLFRTNTIIEYAASGYDTRRHYYINDTLNTTAGGHKNTNLSLLLISLGTGVKFTVQDEAENALEDAYIILEKYDVGKDVYRTVAMGQGDSNGEDYIYLRLYDTLYRIRVQVGDETVFVGERGVISTSTVVLTVTEGGWASEVEYLDLPEVELTFDNDTGVFTMTWEIPDGTLRTMCLSVYAKNLTFSGRIADSCTTAISGTIEVNVSDMNGVEFLALGYTKNTYRALKMLTASRLIDQVQKDAPQLAIGFLILITVIMVALWSESASIIILLASLILLIPLGLFSMTTAMFITLAIVGIIIMVKLKR